MTDWQMDSSTDWAADLQANQKTDTHAERHTPTHNPLHIHTHTDWLTHQQTVYPLSEWLPLINLLTGPVKKMPGASWKRGSAVHLTVCVCLCVCIFVCVVQTSGCLWLRINKPINIQSGQKEAWLRGPRGCDGMGSASAWPGGVCETETLHADLFLMSSFDNNETHNDVGMTGKHCLIQTL